ncbi:hypothetical protein [Pyxidicoccus xibeiensis]|uniref:hypothetical protein n=1 Tax=Pyxidicoccus xibeiensis TaxID=2906759 RepID=UPI0020A75C8E|nr:hypothetical protein [Pyxidicoccus xibeiensis]MCP3137621.1 hypothetical protein [Pyxidicoccus xibeiensis]
MLKPISLPPWGQVHPIQKSGRATHTWQHLYHLGQRWDELVGADIHVLRHEAERCTCPPPPGAERKPLPEVAPSCLALLERHHDCYYGPAYLRELARKDTRVGRQLRDSQRLLCFTPRGILVSVGLTPPISVLTAFRPDLPLKSSTGTDEEYFQAADQRWRRGVSTMSSPGTWKAEVLRALEVASQHPPTQPAEAWALSWAIGHCRALSAGEPEVAGLLRKAERLLAQYRPQLVALLEEELRVAPLLAGLKSSLETGLPEEAQDQLLALEDMLVVAEVLGFEAHIQHILTEVSRLASRWPPAMAGFDALARQRLGSSGRAASSLWNTMLTVTTHAPAPRLPGVLQSWLERLDEARDLLGRGARSLDERLGLTQVRLIPQAVLGHAPPAFDVHVEGVCPPDWPLRLFIVDALHSRGELLHEGEDYRRDGERWIFDGWRLEEAEVPALLIALAAPSLPEPASLEQLLKADLAGAWLTELLLSPSSGRTP